MGGKLHAVCVCMEGRPPRVTFQRQLVNCVSCCYWFPDREESAKAIPCAIFIRHTDIVQRFYVYIRCIEDCFSWVTRGVGTPEIKTKIKRRLFSLIMSEACKYMLLFCFVCLLSEERAKSELFPFRMLHRDH